MKDSTRRVALFIIIVGAGSVLVLFDIPVVLLLAGVIFLVILILILSGTVKLPSFKRSKLKKEEKAKKVPAEKKSPAVPKKEKKQKIPGKERHLLKDTGDSIKKAFRAFSVDFKKVRRSRKEKDLHAKKIDDLLDKSIQGAEITSLADVMPEVVPAPKITVPNPFSDLATDTLDTDLLDSINPDDEFPEMEGIDLDIEMPGETPGDKSNQGMQTEEMATLDISLGESEMPIEIDEEEDDEVAEILNAHKDEISMGDDSSLGGLPDSLDDIGDIDLGSIDLGDESESGIPAGPSGSIPSKTGSPPAAAQAPSAASIPSTSMSMSGGGSTRTSEGDMFAFGTGQHQDDDLMASLKTEAKGTKKRENLSLLRDLKDTRVPASDLEKELEGILKSHKQKE
jgi:hypothetical protein